MSFDTEMGPINYVVVAFDAAPIPHDGFDALRALSDAGRVLILDVEFVRKNEDGSAQIVSAQEVGAAEFEGAGAGLIDETDVALVVDSLQAGGVGAVVMYEDLTLLPVLQAWENEGATVVSEGPIILDDFIAAVDAAEAKES